MALIRDVIDRVLSPNREAHAVPVLDGYGVLAALRADPGTNGLPVVQIGTNACKNNTFRP